MVLISDLNAQRAKVGASQVVVPGQAPAVMPSANVKSATPAPGTTTYDPNTRTISGPGTATAGAQSGINKQENSNVYVAPTSNRAAETAYREQNDAHTRALNKPVDITSFGTVAADLMSDFNVDKVNTYVTNGKLTQAQADQIIKNGTLTPEQALNLGLGKTQTVNGQLGLQQLTKSNLETRLKEAKADLAAGIIDQATYDATEKSVQGGLEDANRLISEFKNPYLVTTASGDQQGRLGQIDQQLQELNQPVNFDGLYSYLDHQQAAKLTADREATKAALLREKANILQKQEGANKNIQTTGTPGVTPTNQQGGTGAPEAQGYQVTPITQAMIEGMIGKVEPAQAKFLEGALNMLQQRMLSVGEQFQDDKDQADFELEQFKDITSDMLTRADTVKDISSSLAKRQQSDDEAAAAATKAAELAKNETERQMTQVKLNEQTRQLELSNARKINSMTNRLAIAGGFGSMGGIKQIEDAQVEGDTNVARFVNEIALTNQQYLDRALQIDSNYTAAISGIHRTYGDQMLDIVTKYNDRVDNVQTLLFGSMQKRNDAVQTAKNRMRDSIDKLNDNSLILMQNAVKDSQDQQRHIADQIHSDNRADKTLEYQERMANQRLQVQMDRDDARQRQQEITAEKTEAKQVRAQFNTIANRQAVKDYQTLRDTQARAQDILTRALNSNDPMVLGAAKEAVTVLRAKGLDPTTGVREQEFTRAGYSQSWIDRSKNVFNAMAGGDMTGISTDMVKDFVESMGVMSETQKQAALAEYTPAIGYLNDFNVRSNSVNIDPRTVVPVDFLDDTVMQSYFESGQSSSYNFNYSSYTGSPGESLEEDSKVVDPLANSLMDTGMTMQEIYGDYSGLQFFSTPESEKVTSANGSLGDIASSIGYITQDFDTPISTKNYSQKTVDAWGGKHEGLDIALPSGSFVPSFADGSLMSVAYGKEGWGLTAIIKDDNGVEHRYSHLQSIDPFLKIGDRIEKGMEFAQVGHTGNVFSTSGGDGSHLDYRVKKDGKYIDPYSYYS